MSLCPVYVRAVDGLFYKDPVICHYDWFICFDDDDPPELVVFAKNRKEAYAKLEIIEAQQTFFRRSSPLGSMNFRHHEQTKKYRSACSCWIELVSPIPSQEGKTGTTQTKCPCVIYDPTIKTT